MTDVQSHLSTIAQIDDNDRNLQRGRDRAIEGLTNKVVNSIMGGQTAPASAQLLAATEGFVEAFAAELVKRHGQALYDRATLATAAEQSGCEDGAAAARILRGMNAAASPVFWINQSVAKPWDVEPAQGTVMALPAMPGWQVERTPDGGAKGVCESGIQFFVNGQGCGGVDVQSADQLSRRIILDEFDAGWGDSRARLAKARADLAELKVAEMKADKPIDDFVRDAIAELGTNPETDAITHVLPVGSCWVEVKVERVEDEDTGPEYDTVSQNDIRVGDIVEYHWDGKVRRWEVLDVRENLLPGIGPDRARLKLIGEHNSSEISVEFPLLEDPFILRPRAS